MRKGNSSTQKTRTSSEETARGSSHRPRGRVGRFPEKVRDGANNLRVSRSKDSRSRSPAPPNVLHQCVSSTPNIIEVQAAPSSVEVEADTQSAFQDAQCMQPLSGPAITVTSVGQDAQADLDAAEGFQDTYLEPLRIFDDVIGKIADVHPYAKM
ncbi:hypothetical protein DFJ58DRAFT_917728, partial [Suillus subalutaceus]|uniref:uncharacterized protein n=1 Tax=Suillus subalutaceus TaxID=48586 RepID=UPI001B865E29